MTENRSAVDELTLVTRWGLRRENTELPRSLGRLDLERGERDQRVKDFEFVNQRLNELMASTPSPLREVGLLADELGGRQIPTLEEARKMFYAPGKARQVISSTIEKAIREYPAWARVNLEYPSEGTPASGALIEGFGAFLGSFFSGSTDSSDEARINRLYVLAFEEVLISERPESPLLRDVIGWMKEEIKSFPEDIQLLIFEYGQEPLTSFNFEGKEQAVSYVERTKVAKGVSCGVYSFDRDPKKDLGIIKIAPGCKTPLQKVLNGDRTIEGYRSGKGKLTITKPDGKPEDHPVGGEQQEPFSVTVEIGELMQWEADKESFLVAYEVCFPPYQDGRYENIG